MTSRPGVDIVILSWNRVAMTIDAIGSAVDQEGIDQRVIVLDQGSRPEEREQLREAVADQELVTLIEIDKNLGVPGGRNFAARCGTNPLLMNLDNDAVFDDSTTVARSIDHLQDHPETAIVSLRVLNDSTGDDDPLSWSFPPSLRNRSHETLRVAKYLGGASIMRRHVYEEVGELDETLFFAREELDLAFRVINAGHAIDYLGSSRIRHRVSPVARMNWDNDRFYYLVRNGYFVFEKYLPSRMGVSIRTIGWIVQGCRNRFFGQTFRGLRDGRRMLVAMGPNERAAAPISSDARDYFNRYQNDLEGSLLDRVKMSLLSR